MPDAHGASEGLTSLDDAFLRLRRLWSATRQNIVLDGEDPVDMSGLLVVEACAQGERDGRPVTVGDAARFLDVAPSTASRLVDRAVRAGLVVKDPPRGNGAPVVLRFTATGRALRERALAARLAWLQRQLDGWDSGDVLVLGQLLRRFADQLDRAPGSLPRPEGPGGPL